MFFSTIIEKWMDKTLIEVTPLFGGDINQVYKLRFSDGDSVLKLNNRNRYPAMFEKEATGLKKIAATGCRAPRVVKTFSEGNHQFLILEFIEQERPGAKFWERFGRYLALLHSTQSESFGWEEDNYIGSLEQRNESREKWTDFFIDCRIMPLVEKARQKGLLTQNHSRQFEDLFTRLPQLVPQEAASLIHGDLWSGNLMCGIGMEPVFIDPAAYFGHREMDLAMTLMFGGFDRRFMNSYNEVLPLEPGFEQRVDLHNLYPNLVHLVLFGRSYLGNIERTLRENS